MCQRGRRYWATACPGRPPIWRRGAPEGCAITPPRGPPDALVVLLCGRGAPEGCAIALSRGAPEGGRRYLAVACPGRPMWTEGCAGGVCHIPAEGVAVGPPHALGGLLCSRRGAPEGCAITLPRGHAGGGGIAVGPPHALGGLLCGHRGAPDGCAITQPRECAKGGGAVGPPHAPGGLLCGRSDAPEGCAIALPRLPRRAAGGRPLPLLLLRAPKVGEDFGGRPQGPQEAASRPGKPPRPASRHGNIAKKKSIRPPPPPQPPAAYPDQLGVYRCHWYFGHQNKPQYRQQRASPVTGCPQEDHWCKVK